MTDKAEIHQSNVMRADKCGGLPVCGGQRVRVDQTRHIPRSLVGVLRDCSGPK